MTLSQYMVTLSDFEIEKKEIARGAFGSVQEGWDKERRHVAVKTLIKPPTTKKAQQDLVRELYILAKLKHPACLQLIGFMAQDSSATIITPFMSNGTLDDLLKAYHEKKAPTQFDATKMTCSLYGICSSMQYLHTQNIIHRDFKPANVFIDDNYEICIADFGVSRLYQEDINMTMTVGSPIFMAPELYSDEYDDKYTTSVDVYAFGITLYLYFVKAAMNFDDKKGPIRSQQNLMMRVMKGARLVRTDAIPDQFWEVITQCWTANPGDRPNFAVLADLFETNENLWFKGTDRDQYMAYIKKMKQAFNDEENPPAASPAPKTKSTRRHKRY